MTDDDPRYRCHQCEQGCADLATLHRHTLRAHGRRPTLTELQPGRSSHDPPRSNG